jgi:hypothetical protein
VLSLYKQEAAYHVADGKLSLRTIAQALGIDKRTLVRWCAEPEFKEEVERHSRAWREAIFARGFANKDVRLRLLNDLVRRSTAVLQARAAAAVADERFANVAGAHTGLIVLRERMLHIGRELYQKIYETEVDTGLLSEIMAMLEHIAMETGEWKKKLEVVGDPNKPIQHNLQLRNLGRAKLEQLRDLMLEAQYSVEGLEELYAREPKDAEPVKNIDGGGNS